MKNYRSVNDSGPIQVRQRTVLVGRNESGKTNILLALQSLNPAGGIKKLEMVRDFPRDRHPSGFTPETPVLDTVWELTAEEAKELGRIYPRAKAVHLIEISRPYAARRDVRFRGLEPLPAVRDRASKSLSILVAAIGSGKAKGPPLAEPVQKTLDQLSKAVVTEAVEPAQWGKQVESATASLRTALQAAGIQLSKRASDALTQMERAVGEGPGQDDALRAAEKWVNQRLPVFVYLSEYPQLSGHQHVAEYLKRREEKREDAGDVNFGKLCKVAGLDPKRMQELLAAGDPEQRNMWANRASAYVTKILKDLWKDRELKVRFNLDAHFFDTYVSDPTAGYDVEVNLDDRSRGFLWFFSFYVTFAADTMGGPLESAMLLLDEPGLHLHASSQRDLLNHFKQFRNQIIFTTHSPFMVPIDELESIRTVSATEAGAVVTNDPSGDTKTLFPLQSALGYSLAQTLFVGQKNLVVEGVTDFWYLYAVSEYLRDQGGTSLPEDLVVTPAGGAQKIPYMVALLSSQDLRVLVLFDEEPQAKRAAEDMVKAKLIRDDYVTYVTEGFPTPFQGPASVEDLLGPDVYDALVRETYAAELKGKKLSPDSNVPGLVRRYSEAFQAAGLVFRKSRPARLFLQRIAVTPEKVMPREAQERFGRLFGVVSKRLERMGKRDKGPFETSRRMD